MELTLGSPDVSSELWVSALAALEQRYSKPIFEMWLKPMRPLPVCKTPSWCWPF